MEMVKEDQPAKAPQNQEQMLIMIVMIIHIMIYPRRNVSNVIFLVKHVRKMKKIALNVLNFTYFMKRCAYYSVVMDSFPTIIYVSIALKIVKNAIIKMLKTVLSLYRVIT